MNETLYPPSIQGAPPELTTPNAKYRRQVVIVFISLIVFVLFYFGLIGGTLWIIYKAIEAANTPDTETGKTDSSIYMLAVFAFLLFLYLVKGLFKRHRMGDEMHIEITEREHPALFAFIRKICEDTKAPFPYRIFVSPDVNAAVFYNRSLLSLLIPVKKNLLIGMGLINGLTLSEFKAVLAHEFGHFSQSSMRLGSYVYVANRIILDLVYSRDALDTLLAKAKKSDIRIAIIAYLFAGILWVLRKLMEGAFRIINIFESALSRQMEFHADLVAASVTGSDSLIHALHKLEFTNACLMQAFSDLKDASEHKLYTHDIYFHQTQAVSHLRKTLNKPELGTVPALPDSPSDLTFLFNKEENSDEGEGMWASHPSHYDREQNVKRVYLRSVEDNRSAWLLFSNPEALRQRMTERFYQNVLELTAKTDFAAPETVQAFIDQEHAETRQDARYLGLYDGRLLQIPLEQLTAYANDPSLPHLPDTQIRALLRRLYHAEFKEWQEAHYKRREEDAFLDALESGQAKMKGGSFEFRGKSYQKRDLKMLQTRLEEELNADNEWLRQFDREVFIVHLRMAQRLGEGDNDLYQRYHFHLFLQETVKVVRSREMHLIGILNFVSSKEGGGLSQAEFAQVVGGLREIHQAVWETLTQAQQQPLPLLQNMQEGLSLSQALLEEPFVAPLPEKVERTDGEWVGKLIGQISHMEDRCRRLYFKSMGAILSRQETIADTWQDRFGREVVWKMPDEIMEGAGVGTLEAQTNNTVITPPTP